MNDREWQPSIADIGVGHKKRKHNSGDWVFFLIVAICVLTMVFMIGQITQMTSGVLGDSSGDHQNGAAGNASGDDEDGNGLPLICIDAGHGYDDTGATHANLGGLDEKDINLDIVLRMVRLMQEKGYPVLLTRDSDEIPAELGTDERGLYVLDVYRRCDIANEAEVDLFVSVHCNALPSNETVRGMQLYYTEGHTPDNPEYAQSLADSMESVFGERPKIIANPENDSYVVNRLVEAPSVLVETGFITNAEDAKLLLSESWRQQMAEALVEGIIEFLRDKT